MTYERTALRSVYAPDYETESYDLLYQLLAERQPEESISHRAMPSFKAHVDFVRSRPYVAWYVVVRGDKAVGACYLTSRGEVGIGILREHRGKGLAKDALMLLFGLHPRHEYLANINPHNLVSLKLFESIGFKGPIQVTLRKDSHA